MNFAPHHQFTGCQRLQERVEGLRTAGAVPAPLLAEYNKYHFSLVNKLRSARDHMDLLKAFLGETAQVQQAVPQEVVFQANHHFDGYLHALGSAMDILAREVMTYMGIALPNNVYYKTARERVNATRAGDAILPLLDDPPWKAEFSDYRNTATHERLIAANYAIEVHVDGGQSHKRVNLPLPDDPRATPHTFNRNKDIVAYCEKTFFRVVSHTNQIYGHIAQRAAAIGALPF